MRRQRSILAFCSNKRKHPRHQNEELPVSRSLTTTDPTKFDRLPGTNVSSNSAGYVSHAMLRYQRCTISREWDVLKSRHGPCLSCQLFHNHKAKNVTVQFHLNMSFTTLSSFRMTSGLTKTLHIQENNSCTAESVRHRCRMSFTTRSKRETMRVASVI
jgi:hypothetical protein